MPTPEETTQATIPPGFTPGTRPGRNSNASRDPSRRFAATMWTRAMPTHATRTAPWYESHVLMNEKTFMAIAMNEITPTKSTQTVRGRVRLSVRAKKLWKFVEAT